jgi:hypothetical protein
MTPPSRAVIDRKGQQHVKKLLAAGAFGLLLAGSTIVGATAAPGPNGQNDHGLCTAYFNGQKTGWGKNGTPGPFAALEDAADDGDDSTSVEQDVYNYCTGVEKGIGGNPGENGRFPSCFDDGDCSN